MIGSAGTFQLMRVVLLSCLSISCIYGQDSAPNPKPTNGFNQSSLPDAQALLDSYFSTTRDFNAAQSLSLVGEVTLKNLPLKGKLTMYTEKGGKLYRVIDFPPVGKIEAGSDGTVAWERNFTSAARILPKDETQQNFFGLDPAIAESWKTQFRLETIGNETVDGKSCFAVRMIPIGVGRPITIWLDAATGLLVKSVAIVHRSDGDIAVTQILRDYRDENGMTVPHKFEIVSEPPMQIDLQEIKINVELPQDVFKLPDDVRALAARQSTDQPAK